MQQLLVLVRKRHARSPLPSLQRRRSGSKTKAWSSLRDAPIAGREGEKKMEENDNREQLKNTFPSNSKTVKREPQQPKVEDRKIEKVVTGLVKKQKRGFGKKLAETFLEDDTKSVGSYIFHDVLIPAAKAMISDMVGGGIEMLLFGDRRGRNTRREGGRSFTSYGSYYRSTDRDRDRDRDRVGRDISKVGRARHDFDEIILETRGEAEEVLSHLVDLIIDYNQATVADLYGLVGISENFTDNKYGWTDLRSASVTRVRGGYLINLPRTQLLD